MTNPLPFLLYRILGNDLPPRHEAGQTLARLRFILEHEPPLPGCEKRWVLNRIVDPAVEDAARRLIEAAGHRVLHIPFEFDVYAGIPYAHDGLAPGQFHHAPEFLDLPRADQAIIVDWCVRGRNSYLTNLNGARNAALREGRGLARWVLPFDGQLFLTAEAWEAIRTAAEQEGDARYLIVPMVRLPDDRILLDGGAMPPADQEPSIAFRSDALESFDENLRYGHGNKAVLLARLGVSGAWTPAHQARQFAERDGPSADAGRFRWAGWVARLTSGNPAADRDAGARLHARVASLFTFIERLDDRVIQRYWRPGEPLLYRHRRPPLPWVVEVLKAAAARPGDGPDVRAIVAGVLAGAATGERVHSDGSVRRMAAAADAMDASWQRLLDAPAGDPTPLVAAGSLVPALDAVLIAHAQGLVPDRTVSGMRRMARGLLKRLLSPIDGRAALTARDADGTWFEVVVLGLAAFAGDVAAMRGVLRRAPMRVLQQIARDGTQPEEAPRGDSTHRALVNLEGWACLARMALPLGLDIWSVGTDSGPRFLPALRHLEARLAHPTADASRRRRAQAVLRLSPWRPPQWSPAEQRRALGESEKDCALPPFWPLLLDGVAASPAAAPADYHAGTKGPVGDAGSSGG